MPDSVLSSAMPNTITIRPMRLVDIEAVGALAGRIWRQYYPGIISQAKIEYILELMYTPPSLREQMEKGHRFWLVSLNGVLTGYVSAEMQGDVCYLHKLYVDPATHGRGLGRALLEKAIAEMRPKMMILGVNRGNIAAINFYFQHGFRIVEIKDIPIGSGFFMEHFIMKRTL